MSKKPHKKRKKVKSMKTLTKGYEEFIKGREKKTTKSGFDKLLKKTVKEK